MLFSDFIKLTPKIIKEVVPAEMAHEKMMPSNRIDLLKKLDLEKISPKKAAVMLLFYPKNEQTHLVLIHRTSYNGVHSSQIAFPGGKPEKYDQNLKETALRETQEEIGISPNEIQILRAFTEIYIPPSNYMVYPFMGIAAERLFFTPQESEVAAIVELPLSHFLSDEIVSSKKMSTSYANEIEVPGFMVDGHFVWGATAMILSEVKETLKRVF